MLLCSLQQKAELRLLSGHIVFRPAGAGERPIVMSRSDRLVVLPLIINVTRINLTTLLNGVPAILARPTERSRLIVLTRPLIGFYLSSSDKPLRLAYARRRA